MLDVRVSDRAPSSDEWTRLVDRAHFASPFQTEAWIGAWWTHYGADKSPYWLELRDSGDLVGLYPMYRTGGPWRTLRAIGTGQSDYLHPLVAEGREADVSLALAEHLRAAKDLDLADLHQVRNGFALDGATPVEQAKCLVLDLPTNYDAYLGTIGKSLRFDCRKLEKGAFRSGEAKIKEAGPEEAGRALNAFFDLHAQRWRKRGLPGAFATRRLKAFHRDAVAGLAKAAQLRMTVLETKGDVIGVLYGMQVKGTRFFYQCGFNPEYKSLSPGTLLVASAIKSAIEEGCARFDFLRGDEPYKRRWNPQHTFVNMRYILPLNSGLGSVGRAVNHAGSKIEERIRARLEGRGLLG